MQTAPDFKLRSTLVLTGLSVQEASNFLKHQAEHHNLKLTKDEEGNLSCATPFANVFLKVSGDTPEIVVQAASQDMLYLVQEDLSEHLGELDAERAGKMQWSSIFTPGSYPPNFRLAEVINVRRVNSSYNRVRIKTDGLSDFTSGGMHFRLLIPASGALKAVAYPTIGENGQTVWPKGEDALHRPVYTTRRVNIEQGWLEFDVFRHAGGRATEWSEKAVPGTEVGLMGPGGGTLPKASRILLAGDETALPAISRIVEHLEADACGTLLLLTDEATVPEDVALPAGVSIRLVERGSSRHPLLDAVKVSSLLQESPYIWFASEKSETKAARSYFETCDWFDPQASYIAAYWTAR
ncbi:siderophore-interacting protein [Roseibium sp.]|uniref:siderophore-interacting protein n=1 Tax=Roseibium sp. TaxID=1936156 RepID=UPI003A979A95